MKELVASMMDGLGGGLYIWVDNEGEPRVVLEAGDGQRVCFHFSQIDRVMDVLARWKRLVNALPPEPRQPEEEDAE